MVAPLPPYPPQHDAWEYPPPPVSRRWLWGAIGAAVVATIAIAALVTSLVVAGTRDLQASIDDVDLVDAIDQGCSSIAQVESIDVDSISVDRAGRVEAQTTIVRDVVAQWQELDPELRASDEPFDQWVADWQLLVDARDAYVAELRTTPNALFEEPEVDGRPIVERMDAVSTGCPVPQTLVEPDAGIRALA